MKKLITLVTLLVLVAIVLTGCSEASKVNYNLSKSANYFNVMRRITVYNARTDNVILEIEGLMSLDNDSNSELIVTCKTGPETYKKNYVYLNDYVLYVVEDIDGTAVDPYHYKLYFHTSNPIDIETRP